MSEDNIIDFEEEVEKKEEAEVIAPEKSELEKLQEENSELKDKFTRAIADYQNLQKRVQTERADMAKFGSQKLAQALIPTLDNFNYAWKADEAQNNTEEKDYKKFYESVQLIYKNLIQSLESQGIKLITPNKGDEVNVKEHEALMELESEIENGKIAEILSPGYKLHDRVIKVAQVAVSK